MEEETGNNNSNEVGDKENVLSDPVSNEVGDSSTKLEDKKNVLSNNVSNVGGDSCMKLEDKENLLSDPVSNEVGNSGTKLEYKENVLSDPVSSEVGDSSMNLEDTENELPNPFVTTIHISTETCYLSTIIEETEYDDDDQTSEYVSEVQTMEFRQLDEDKQSGEDDVSDEEIEITFEPGPLDNK